MAKTATKKTGAPANGQMPDAHKLLEQYVYSTATFVDVRLDHLIFDPSYQRETSAPAVQRIASGYDPMLFDPPTVNKRSADRYAVIDGQHRIAAIVQLGHKNVTCRVVKLQQEEEPLLFVQLNRQRRWLTPVQTFKAELAGGNRSVQEINRCISERGLRVAATQAPDCIGAASAIKKVYAAGGYVRLAEVVDTLGGAWPENEPRRFAGQLILGLTTFLEEEKSVDLGRLVERLTRLTARQLIARGNARWHAWRGLNESGGSLIEATASEIKRTYNAR